MQHAQTRSPECSRGGVLERFARCRRGVAAIEFGYIAPVMFLMFMGSLEFSRAITVDRRVTQVASSTADLIARQTAVTDTDLSGYLQIVSHLLAPYSDAPLKLTVVSVTADASDDDTRVSWCYNRSVDVNGSSVSKGVHSYTSGAAYSLPDNIIGQGESVIVVEATYDYQPFIVSYFITTARTFTETFYLKPRLSANVAKSTGSMDCT